MFIRKSIAVVYYFWSSEFTVQPNGRIYYLLFTVKPLSKQKLKFSLCAASFPKCLNILSNLSNKKSQIRSFL